MATGNQGVSWSGGPSKGQRNPGQNRTKYYKQVQADLNKRFGKGGIKKKKAGLTKEK